jgi:hypothetical protein
MAVSSTYLRRMALEKELDSLRRLIRETGDPAARRGMSEREQVLVLQLAGKKPAEIMRRVFLTDQVTGRRICIDCSRPYDYETSRSPRCRDCRNAERRRKWDELTPEEKRAIGHKVHKRALTPGQFAAKSAAQGDTCAICGAAPDERPAGRPRKDGTRTMVSGLSYDHCHETGIGRDLLCQRCNVLLGMANDDPERLEGAAAYLRRWKAAHGAHAPEPEKSCAENEMAALEVQVRKSLAALRQTQLQFP